MRKMQQCVTLLSTTMFLFLITISCVFKGVAGHGAEHATVAEECSDEVQKLMGCLNYATGKVNEPTKDCCSSVKDMKDSDPKCLCYIMQQTHNGSEQIKSLGIQEARLLQLPSACKMENTSLSYCPKLLGISPTSPDAAIFTNTSTPATPAAATGVSAPERTDSANNGIQHRPLPAGPLVIAMAIFMYAFSAGSTSLLSASW